MNYASANPCLPGILTKLIQALFIVLSVSWGTASHAATCDYDGPFTNTSDTKIDVNDFGVIKEGVYFNFPATMTTTIECGTYIVKEVKEYIRGETITESKPRTGGIQRGSLYTASDLYMEDYHFYQTPPPTYTGAWSTHPSDLIRAYVEGANAAQRSCTPLTQEGYLQRIGQSIWEVPVFVLRDGIEYQVNVKVGPLGPGAIVIAGDAIINRKIGCYPRGEYPHVLAKLITLLEPIPGTTKAVEKITTKYSQLCPAPRQSSGGRCVLPPDVIDPKGNLGPICPDKSTGNPCNPGTGNKYQVEVDYAGSGFAPIRFERVYNSGPVEGKTLGKGWLHTYERSIEVVTGGGLTTATVKRHTGQEIYFNSINGKWHGDANSVGILSGEGANLYYFDQSGDIESYSNGLLISISPPGNVTYKLKFEYNCVATRCVVRKVISRSGRVMSFEYDPAHRLVKMIDPALGVYEYTYSDTDPTPMLSSVTYPGMGKRSYLYGEQGKVGSMPALKAGTLLTGLIDEKETRHSTWTYDDEGKVSSTEHGVGQDKFMLQYDGALASTETRPNGAKFARVFTVKNGIVKESSRSQPAASGAPAAFQAATYDQNGNIRTFTDPNGNLTTYTFDLTRNLETSRIEGAGHAERRVITKAWHPQLRLPVAIAEPKRITRITYNADGNILTQAVQATNDVDGSLGLSAVVVGSARQTKNDYNATGQLTKITGPRLDVVEESTFTYDPASGDLLSVTNAAGQITSLSAYDAHGRVGQIHAPNAVVTSFTYTPRGWLDTRTVSAGGVSQVTRFTYDRLGQLEQLETPDGARITYRYDDIGRMDRATCKTA